MSISYRNKLIIKVKKLLNYSSLYSKNRIVFDMAQSIKNVFVEFRDSSDFLYMMR